MLLRKMIFRLGLGRIQHIFEITGTVSSKQVNSNRESVSEWEASNVMAIRYLQYYGSD